MCMHLQEFYLDLKLFSCADQRVDLGRQGSMIELGVAEVSLNGMAAGSVADLMQMPVGACRMRGC